VIGSKSENDRSRTVWRRKKELLSPLPLVLWTASSGSAAKASRSSLFGGHRRIEVPGPVDDTMFRPLPMAVAREALRLPQDKKVILLAATLLDEERKGMRHAVEALNVLRAIAEPGGDVRPDNVHLVLVGRGARTLALSLAFAHTNVGFLSDQIALALAYQSADVFLCPSTDDEGPMMVTESMLCGTPVVMFRVGISGDLIRDGETGYSAPVGDAAGLARGLLAVLTDQVPCNMRAAARDAAVEAQSPGRVMPRLEASFRDLVAEMGPKA
jgi:glycosyltransferase involved in cell wall biosynthesis